VGDVGKPEKSRDPHRDLAGVLHDVSNALTVLLGWIGETRAPDATPETIAYALTIIEQRARIARDLARVAIGAARIDEQRPAGEIVAEVAATLRVEAEKCGASIALTGEDTSAALAAAVDVSQVVTNLVMNAIAYAPKGTAVDVAVGEEGDRVQVTVTDHGPGVPAKSRDAIFEGESTRPGGTGVGLRHSRALARAWGGDVILLPQEEGKGASFRVSWPRADAVVPRPPTSSARVRGLSGVRVLLIEDDIAVTQLLETALEGRGADVTVAATSGELATALASADAPFDAALMDLSPIAADPAAAIASLRKCSPNIELVLITGSADRLPDAVATEAMKLVRKPFELGEVLAVLGGLTKKP
jgi:CheY-like chemotaxis protein/anti-sigma regulatory factor (Ser/Thr protein kinase)